MRYDAGFLEAICENPDDDVPRLVYADWLEERGDPRGEFIRLQCILASMPDNDERRWSLLAREKQLLWLHGKNWAGPLRRQVRQYAFRRGFVEAITLGAADFLSKGDDLLRLAPVRQVCLLDAQDRLADLADSPLLNRLTGLDLRHTNGLSAERAAPLLRSPRLAGLRSLGLCGTGLVSSPGVRALAACPHLTGLTALDLGDERGDEEVRRGWLYRRAQGIYLNTPSIRALVESPFLTGLRSLALSGGPPDGMPFEAMQLLLGSRMLAGLRELELQLSWTVQQHGTDSLLRLIGRSPQAAGLRRLRIAPKTPLNPLDANWVLPFPREACLTVLTTLEIERSRLSDSWVAALADGAFPALRTLRLRNCEASNRRGINSNLLALVENPGLLRLSALDLGETPVGPPMIRALTEGQTLLAGLRWLSLSNRKRDGSPVGSETVRSLATSPAAAQLVHLDLSNNQVDDSAARALATSPFLGNLAALGLGRNRIGAGRGRPPNGHVRPSQGIDLPRPARQSLACERSGGAAPALWVRSPLRPGTRTTRLTWLRMLQTSRAGRLRPSW